MEHPDEAEQVRLGDTGLAETCALESTRMAQRSIMARFTLAPFTIDLEEGPLEIPSGMTVATLLPLTNRERGAGARPTGTRRGGTVGGCARRTGWPAAELVTVFGHGGHSCPARPFSLAAMTLTSRRLLSASSGGSRPGPSIRSRCARRSVAWPVRPQHRVAPATGDGEGGSAATRRLTKTEDAPGGPNRRKRRREPPCAWPSGEPCTSRSIRRPTSSRTRSAFGWPHPMTGGVARPGHGSGRHPVVPGRHRRPRPLRRGPGRRAGRSRRGPVRHSGCRARHVRPAESRSSRRVSGSSRSTSPVLRPGSGGGWSSSASACRSGCGWCRSTSSEGDRGGTSCVAAGFDPARPAVVVSTGVTLYLSKEANAATLRQMAELAPGSTLAMTFLLPSELVETSCGLGSKRPRRGPRGRDALRQLLHAGRNDGAGASRPDSGTPGTSRAAALNERYFAGRTDGLRTARGEELLIATT